MSCSGLALAQRSVLYGAKSPLFSWTRNPASTPVDGLSQFPFLSWDWFRTVLVCPLYVAVAAPILHITTELEVFVVPGWTGDMAAGAWSGQGRLGS